MIKSVGKRIIVKEITEEKEEKKSLILSVNEKKPLKALVIAIGTDVDEQLIESDVVILNAHTGTSVEIEGEKYLAIYEDQILAVVGK
jgi:co-chaperonin GroES (HSP10)